MQRFRNRRQPPRRGATLIELGMELLFAVWWIGLVVWVWNWTAGWERFSRIATCVLTLPLTFMVGAALTLGTGLAWSGVCLLLSGELSAERDTEGGPDLSRSDRASDQSPRS